MSFLRIITDYYYPLKVSKYIQVIIKKDKDIEL